jgi:multidrug/hemolysin transport system permease protein
MLPTGIQNLANVIPGSYSTGLFRRIFMGGVFDHMSENISPAMVTQIKDVYSFELVLFNQTISRSGMYIYLSLSIVVFFFLYLLLDKIKTIKLS